MLMGLWSDGRKTFKVYDKDAWEGCIRTSHSLFVSINFKEIQYRILHRKHRTPYVMNKIDPNRSPLCLKCKLTSGTYIHCFWSCPRISKFWSCVSKEVTAIFKHNICKVSGQFLLGLPPLNRVMDVKRSKLLNKLLLLARMYLIS